ncbi:right-handed parallel beta-helix repeat-containing protein, partial [archaeon]|nr:right-handed parallel beta-helix repeat-containing protein [archaeon]
MKLTSKAFLLIVVGVALLFIPWMMPVNGYAAGKAYVRYVDAVEGKDSPDAQGLALGIGAWKTLHFALAAINGLLTDPLDSCTLYVASGDYKHTSDPESEPDEILEITVNNLTIVGALSPSMPVIDGQSATYWANGIQIGNDTFSASNVSIRNLVVQNFAASSSGIKMVSGNNNTIEHCEIRNNQYGVHILPGSSGNQIQGCYVYGNHDGIYIWQSDNCTISGCQIYSNNYDGIVMSNSANSIITQNTIHDNYEENNSNGIFVQACSPEISRNTIYDNRFNVSIQADSGETTSPTIVNNLIYQVASGKVHFGILMGGAGTANPKIYHNTINAGVYDGIYMDGVGNAPEIKYNIISNFGRFGIENLNSVGNPVIDFNDVWGNTSGAYDGCINPVPGENNISLDPMYGSYTLLGTSPCINAIPTGSHPNDPITVDMNGTARPYGSGFDMGCYEDNTLPAVTTTAVSSITSTTATSGGNVTSAGGFAVTSRGVCWSTSANPITSDSKTTDGAGTGIFNSTITELSPNTTYHVRAYATNGNGTSYGSDTTFTTTALPTVTTTTVSSITSTTATSGGNVTSAGGFAVTARGICWSTSANPTTSDSK